MLELNEPPWLEEFLQLTPMLDVRAPIEYADGHAPFAVNHPILNDRERHEVGIAYKSLGADQAMALGHRLVSGKNRQEKLQSWIQHFNQYPTSWLYCFRGGQRSEIAETWLRAEGYQVRRVKGGYKEIRRFLMHVLETIPRSKKVRVLTGMTGSGKTELLNIRLERFPSTTLDLESLARHRGSVFGQTADDQLKQAQFENELALKLLKLDRKSAAWLEDESRSIGHNVIPEVFFQTMSQAPLYLVEAPPIERALRIFQEYVVAPLNGAAQLRPWEESLDDLARVLSQPLARISKKLGGDRYRQAQKLLLDAFARSRAAQKLTFDDHQFWILFLLQNYYDPLYQSHLDRNQERVTWRGSFSEAQELLLQTSDLL